MEKFSLRVQQKISVWQETYVEIEAPSVERAAAIISSMGSIDQVVTRSGGSSIPYDFTSIDHIYGTEEELTPKDNDGQSTFEIYSGGRLMYKNGE